MMTTRAQTPARTRARRPFLLALAASCALGASALAQAPAAVGDAVAQANRPYTFIEQPKRSDVVLLPALIKMDAPPASVSTPFRARLMSTQNPAFAEAQAWATGANQTAALAALAQITKATDLRDAMAFGLPYGADGVAPALVRAKAYVELGDPPTLASAQFLYFDWIVRLEILVNVEATRLSAEGKPNDAVELLSNLIYLGRQLCDRQMSPEIVLGLQIMSRSFERIRDVAYQDLLGPRAFDIDRLRAQITRLQSSDNAILDLSRVRPADGDRLGARQVVERLYGVGGQVDPVQFATTMARLSAGDKPLRLFSETGRWRALAGNQAPGTEALERTDAVYADFGSRWRTAWFDRIQGTPTVYSQLGDRFAVVQSAAKDLQPMRLARQITLVEAAGARAALAIVGHTVANRAFPTQFSSVRPRFLPRLEHDPFNPTPSATGITPLEYLLPARTGPAGTGQPHEVEVVKEVPEVGNVNFKVTLKDDVFLLYSWGSDNARNFARRVQNTAQVVQGADYLLFPSELTLYRQFLRDKGETP